MAASNYDDVLAQLQAEGLIIPHGEGLRIGTPKPQRVRVEGGGREKRGWYWLREWSPSHDRLLIVGAFGVWQGAERIQYKVELPKDDRARFTAEQKQALRDAWAEAAKAAEAQVKREQEHAARRAMRMWARPELAEVRESPYLVSKGIDGAAVRDVRYTPNGTAVLSVQDTSGRIHGLQFLRTAAQAKAAGRPSKEFWPRGLAKQGHYFPIGDFSPAPSVILLGEGFATMADLHNATGIPAVVAFDAGNLTAVAKNLRKRFKTSRILLCADNDILGKCRDPGCRSRLVLPLNPENCPTCGKPHGYSNAGVDNANTAALAVGGAVLVPEFEDVDGLIARYLEKGTKDTDFNDLKRLEGRARVAAQVADRLDALGWSEAPAAPARVSSTSSGAGEKLRVVQKLDDLLGRFATVWGSNGGVFDRCEHSLVTDSDVRRICIRGDLYKAWMEHPDREIVRQREVGFDPSETDPTVTCNLWAGWPTTPEAGRCDRLLETLRHMCSGERNSGELYEWVLRWLAYPIQHPGAKMRSTIVVHGPQGTGKNMFFETVMAIYGEYGRILDQSALQDKHNDCFSRKLFLIADEVIAQKERYDIKNMLKTLITGTRIRINPKHMAAYEEENHVNLVFLSNESMPVVLEKDDRRHCIIWTPPKLSAEFYQSVQKELNEGGMEALHDYLLHLDLGNFHEATPPPYTKAKDDLISLAIDSPDEFVNALYAGDIEYLKPIPGPSQAWYDIYKHWCVQVGIKPASQKRFLDYLDRKLGFQAERERYQIGVQVKQQRMITWGMEPKEGMSKQEWLGEEMERFQQAMTDFRGLKA